MSSTISKSKEMDNVSTNIAEMEVKTPFDWKRVFFLLLGVALFLYHLLCPALA